MSDTIRLHQQPIGQFKTAKIMPQYFDSKIATEFARCKIEFIHAGKSA